MFLAQKSKEVSSTKSLGAVRPWIMMKTIGSRCDGGMKRGGMFKCYCPEHVIILKIDFMGAGWKSMEKIKGIDL